MTLEEKLRDELPTDLPIDLRERIIDAASTDGSDLPIDKGLEVIIKQVPGDEFASSHPHFVDEECYVLHLTPEDAREYDRHLDEFTSQMLVDALDEMNDPTDSFDNDREFSL